MITITVGNSASKITGLNTQQFNKLKKILCYRDTTKLVQRLVVSEKTGKPVRKRVYPIKYLIGKNGAYPTGLHYLVQLFIKNNNLQCHITDNRKLPTLKQLSKETLFKNKLKTPYPEQLEAAEACLKHGRGIISAPTGIGKSFICELIIEKLQVKTLVVVPTLILKEQLTNSLREAFGDDLAGPMINGKCISFITVENIDQLTNSKIKPAVDCIIVDEFHHSGASSYRKLNYKQWDDVYFKFGLTATPFRSSSSEKILLESVLSKVIYKISYATAVEKGYIVPMEAYYVELPKIKVTGATYDEVYKELVVGRQDRNETIIDMIENLYEQKISTLVLVNHIEHGEILRLMALERNLFIPLAQGSNEDNDALIEAFNARKVNVMIATGVIGEGVDTKPCEYVILAAGGKSRNQFYQRIGRGFRKYPGKESVKVILFKDPSNRWISAHAKECIKYLLDDFNIEPTKL